MIPLWTVQLKQTVLLAVLKQGDSIPTSRSLRHSINCAGAEEPDTPSEQICFKSLSLVGYYLTLISVIHIKVPRTLQKWLRRQSVFFFFFVHSDGLNFSQCSSLDLDHIGLITHFKYCQTTAFVHLNNWSIYCTVCPFLICPVLFCNCLQTCTVKSLICCFSAFFCFCSPGGVLLVSVQGIAVNVDPVFCTWLLYQPHRGSSRQQVPNPLASWPCVSTF